MFFLKRKWMDGLFRSDQIRAYVRMAGTEDGLTIIHDLANRFHLVTPHDGSARSEGQRDVINYIIQQSNFTTDDFLRLQETENQGS